WLTLPYLLHYGLMAMGDSHGAARFFFLTPLAGAYPFSAATEFPLWLAGALTVLQMAALAWVFARYTRIFPPVSQAFAALLAIGLLALLGDIAYAVFAVELNDVSFPWQ